MVNEAGSSPHVLDVSRGLAVVRTRIERAGGDPQAVTVLAVTKGFGPGALVAARAAGLSQVGENYAAELLAKRGADETAGFAPLRWHFLGAIQTNKIRSLAAAVDCWQSVSRPVEAERIAAAAPGATVLLQVALSADPDRRGCRPEGIPSLCSSARELGLEVIGLMAVAPFGASEARSGFARVRGLADDLGLPVRSMGMSDDLELAVAEGSTMVRVGRALFGERPASSAPARFGR